MNIYLAGPINGCTDEEARGWREQAKKELWWHNVIDPMVRDYRGKELDNVDDIVAGDLGDIERANVILVNASRPSWGTAMEIVYAVKLMNKRVIAVCPSQYPSPWLLHHATVVRSYEEAFRLI